MESKYKDLPDGKQNEDIGDDFYDNDPDFEKIANINNNDETKKSDEDSYDYDDSLNFN